MNDQGIKLMNIHTQKFISSFCTFGLVCMLCMQGNDGRNYSRQNSGVAKESKATQNDGQSCDLPLERIVSNSQWNDEQSGCIPQNFEESVYPA